MPHKRPPTLPKKRAEAKALLRMGQNKAEIRRRLKLSERDADSAAAEVKLESLPPDEAAAVRALEQMMTPPGKLPTNAAGEPIKPSGKGLKTNPQADLRKIRRRLRQGLPLHERADILIQLARNEDPRIQMKAIEEINALDALTSAAKAQGERPAPGPMFILPADAVPDPSPVHTPGNVPSDLTAPAESASILSPSPVADGPG